MILYIKRNILRGGDLSNFDFFTQSFLGGNNKAPIPSDVYFLLCIFNFTYCIYVHNLCIDVRCIEINYKE